MALPKHGKEDDAYLAGILDGEGCISARQGKRGIDFRVVVGNVSLALMEWLTSRYGGTVYPTKTKSPRHQPFWIWKCSRTEGVECLRAALPYLVVKREQAELFIALTELSSEARGGRRATPDNLIRRSVIMTKLSALKKGA
jgi:hypothetical protein